MIRKHPHCNRGSIGKRVAVWNETVTVAVGIPAAGEASSTERAASMRGSCAPKVESARHARRLSEDSFSKSEGRFIPSPP